MIPIPSGVRVWISTGPTDMRKGMAGLALQVQEALKRDPHDGALFVFRGKRGDLVKAIRPNLDADTVLLLMGARDPSLAHFAAEVWEELQ